MDEWHPWLGWLIGGVAVIATGVVIYLAWPAAAPQIQQAMRAPPEAAPTDALAGGAAPAITESRSVGNSRVHRID